MRWKENGDFKSEDIRVIYSGGKKSEAGVAILLDKKCKNNISDIDCVNERKIKKQKSKANQ